MRRRSDILEMAMLGVLAEGPLHGYELRKQLIPILGSLRPISFGSMYPALRRLADRGLIEPGDPTPAVNTTAPPLSARRSRIVYAITAEGKESFSDWVNHPGPEAWEDESFAAHLAFFSKTEGRVRLRILQGRRSRIEERIATLRESMTRAGQRVDAYTLALQQHGLDGAEREVRWLDELISEEQARPTESHQRQPHQSETHPSETQEST
jgi:DNA-binding PadR family transcriptional regulator